MTVAVAHQSIDTCFPAGFNPEWPEPIQRVQTLAESGLNSVPSQYIRPEPERPKPSDHDNLEVPLVDLSGLDTNSATTSRKLTLAEIGHACEEWGFFQIINHGIPLSLLQKVRMICRQFFDMPIEEKQEYANNPRTYEGYGSRLGVEKGATLDWGDYYYLNILPKCSRDMSKWPSKPALWRETMEEYSQHIWKLSERLLEAISCTLDISPTALKEAFGGDDSCGLSLRVNFYPPCPQPELTLGLSAHSDPGGLTILLQDDQVEGLQIRHDGEWVPVKIIPGSLVVNLADQIQILSNGIYKSVEHRVVVNSQKKRISVAAFCNPANDIVVAPLKALVNDSTPPLYMSMTFAEYRSFIRRSGTKGKEIVESVSSPRPHYIASKLRSLSLPA